MDTERALLKVDELLELCGRARGIYDNVDQYYRNATYVQARTEIIALLPGVRRIAEVAYPRILSDFVEHDQMYTFPWRVVETQALELRGALASAGEFDEILGPTGPKMSAGSLHPWVWNAAVDLWHNGHHRQAVLDAYTKVETMVQAEVGTDANGKGLWSEVFTPEAPASGRARLRFPGVEQGTDRWRSAHEGAMHLGMACSQGLRNWAAHTLDDADDQLALEYLASLSVLARWASQCAVASA